ncbi:MAG: DNA recombination/repair protein RecA, partial [Planctomycetaceae bacterium]
MAAKKARATASSPAKRESDNKALLDNALGQIKKTFGDGSIMKLDAPESAGAFPGISTGALSLDLALGGNG